MIHVDIDVTYQRNADGTLSWQMVLNDDRSAKQPCPVRLSSDRSTEPNMHGSTRRFADQLTVPPRSPHLLYRQGEAVELHRELHRGNSQSQAHPSRGAAC
jgi:hypothetical protein